MTEEDSSQIWRHPRHPRLPILAQQLPHPGPLIAPANAVRTKRSGYLLEPLGAAAGGGKTVLLVRVDHVAIGDAVHLANASHNLLGGVGVAGVVLHEDVGL